MAKNNKLVTDNPKLLEKTLSDGNIALYLDYYLGRNTVYDEKRGAMVSKVQRKREFLKLTILANPRTPIERQTNRETYELARKIRFEREQEFKENMLGYRLRKERTINFLDYFQAYNDRYTKKDVRMMKGVLVRFIDFLKIEYPQYSTYLKPEQITKDMVSLFVEYLQSRSKGEGALDYYSKFKKVINYAVDNDVIARNPCKGIVCKCDKQVLRKDVLSLDEMQALISTHYDNENPEIRRAFIFCLYTGIRFCDVQDLKYSNVDYSNKILSFEQNKTKGHSANSGVVIPLNDDLLQLIGEPHTEQYEEETIFRLPSATMCLKALRRWTKRAGITKHITWHCARHSFAVNILNNGANIKTVASLLGHSGLKHTEKYTRAVDSLKEAAINSLPKLKL
ncbi:site-specific integrase [Bacteroides thetaiotaomicron]|uniref:Site-specific integrase n=1 Tax=Bacteroides thetaiotaomicron TaxID=818 RepID=A0A6I0S1S6_BACT4|nr:site-specific integrase [Bacteroides thetaiotaomicron]KAB4459696.1 site-specific integrase [Bacteroides thetaiotaomicron]KAB4468427.1 site-specific integrase [Bacteroides thetaiotaomicron]KAB4468680.1 site-specific integrase [Bacteroides thetaiotaomicron]KAB4480019.1 site-specific integrase [Bacteroides thetaiotaomicron]